MNNWLLQKIISSKIYTKLTERKEIPVGIWLKCQGCQTALYRPELENNYYVCPKCNYHFSLTARKRIKMLLEEEGQEELFADLAAKDQLEFKDNKTYKDRLAHAQKSTGEKDALIAIKGWISNLPVIGTFFDFNFIGGSMGTVVGEKFVRAVEACIKERLPLINVSTSGGARMQEGVFSLMQMAKTSAALGKLAKAKLPFISILTHPTTGGVSASLAMLGDVIIAEPGALIGFAGPRIIEQTVHQRLPEGFQKSRFLFEHGMIDMIVNRNHLKNVIVNLLKKLLKKPV